MSCESLELQDQVSLLSHRPRSLLRAMITIPNPPDSLDTEIDAQRSSVGELDILPTELLFFVLQALDLKSISRVSRVSRRGNVIVKSLAAYRNLLDKAPEALAALSQAKLLGVHSVTQLQDTLRSDRCATCPEYGTYLFLPTCERCCWECLFFNPAWRVISPGQATRYFGLSKKHLRQLPVMHSIPGRYDISQENSRTSHKLVSARMARDLGVLKHGSAEEMAKTVTTYKTGIARATVRFLQRSTTGAPRQDPLAVLDQGNVPPDRFFGMATIHFPSVPTPEIVENGLWCRGCELTFKEYTNTYSATSEMLRIVPQGCNPGRILFGMTRRARSRVDFLEHLEHCCGAQKLIQMKETT